METLFSQENLGNNSHMDPGWVQPQYTGVVLVFQVKRERELAAVKINSDDVEVIMKEFDMDRASSERCLREQSGNLVDALRTLVE
mmetsp:Transcript_9228/g.40330  ORF Transcript_9228/g.40330 Transcript_9228/m.40330 type:complete len:85 (-) Transcript_9228:861-1115(-)